MIEFRNTEGIRAGISIKELRTRNHLSPLEFAEKAELNIDYLALLEEGHEDKVAPETIERILIAGRICKRGTQYRSEELKKTLLSVQPPIPPEERLL